MTKNQDELEVSVEIAARPETVFTFFSDPGKFRQWMGEGSELVAARGGTVTVAGPGGPAARGEILEWEENRRIAFSWTAPGVDAACGSRVVVTLSPTPAGTLVTLLHTGLPSAEEKRRHAGGWRHLLATLSAKVAAHQTDGRLDAIVDASLAVWSEPLPEKRSRMLEASWSDDPVFRDPYASVRGRDALEAHIASVLAMAPPGVRLVRRGAVEQCHGHVRYAWRAETPDGTAFASGTNFADLAADGRLARVVGFWDPPTTAGETRPDAGGA